MDKTSEKVFKTVVGIDSINVENDNMFSGNVAAVKTGSNTQYSIMIILVIILIVINIGWLIYFKFLKKKDDEPPMNRPPPNQSTMNQSYANQTMNNQPPMMRR